MDGQMRGLMDERQKVGWTNEWINGRIDAGLMDGWVEEKICGQMDGQTNGQMNERIDDSWREETIDG